MVEPQEYRMYTAELEALGQYLYMRFSPELKKYIQIVCSPYMDMKTRIDAVRILKKNGIPAENILDDECNKN